MQSACKLVISKYASLISRLDDHPQVRAAAERCSGSAAKFIELGSYDGKNELVAWPEIKHEPELCLSEMGKAAEKEDIEFEPPAGWDLD